MAAGWKPAHFQDWVMYDFANYLAQKIARYLALFKNYPAACQLFCVRINAA
jgi:hypothetical protein